MWMGRGMTPMMLTGMQHYMPRVGMGIGPPMLPAIQNLMRLSKLPLVDQAITMAPSTNLTPVGQVNYQTQMQNSSFQQQYANFMGFPNTSQVCFFLSTANDIPSSTLICHLLLLIV